MKSPKIFKDTFYYILIGCLTLFFLSYGVARAIKVSLTFDEAATYLNYISSPILSIFNFDAATNHFLNTIFTKIFFSVAGNSELILRLPNLFGYVVYLIFSLLILNKFVNKFIALSGYLLLNLNPYVLDFFSLCRGYGLSLGFLMAALFFYLLFLDEMTNQKPDAHRHLYFSLLMASASVLSNFTLLNFYVSLIFISFILLIILSLKKDRIFYSYQTVNDRRQKKKWLLFTFILLAAVFNFLTISQNLNFSENLFEPITVKIMGLNEEEKKAIEIYRIDMKNQEMPLAYEDDTWTITPKTYFKGIKFKLPLATIGQIQKVEVKIGNKIFSYAVHDMKRWKNYQTNKYLFFYSNYYLSLKRSAFSLFRNIINWKGDHKFISSLILRIILVLGIYTLIIFIIYLSGKLIIRLKIINIKQFKPLVSTTLGLAILIAYPIYVLKKNNALYWGGHRGIIHDTFFGLIDNSFYGQFYFPHQTHWISLIVILLFLFFIVFFSIGYQKGYFLWLAPGISLLAIIFISSISVIVQGVFFKIPYLFGRTAMFYLPIYVLFLIFSFHYLYHLSRIMKVLAVSTLMILAIFNLAHFYQTANTTYAFEWKHDADTKSMLNDLKNIKEKDLAHLPRVALGIDWIYYPSIKYYLERKHLSWIKLNIIPPVPNNDFYYLEHDIDNSRMTLIKRYTTSGSILAKAKQKRK